MNTEKKPLVPQHYFLSRGQLIVVIIISLIAGAVLREQLRPKVPGFEYQNGKIFAGCYKKETRVAIARCLDKAWETASDIGPNN
jgi:ABC-type long-subunit fatty acid transport system fused permease/ATPase subunit